MGNFLSSLIDPQFVILVKTGDVKWAGTNSNVFIALIDKDGKRSRDISLDCKWHNDFEKGNEDSFKVGNVPDFGTLHSIEIWRDSSGLMDSWFIEYIKVKQYKKDTNNKKTCEEFPYPIHRWIQAKRRYVFNIYDSVLPQFDEHLEQRKKELEENRERYAFGEYNANAPRRIKKVPTEENFSNDYQWDITTRKLQLLAEKFLVKWRTASKWDDLEDLAEVYKGSFGVPSGYHKWKSNEHFGEQRLRGCNAQVIELCEKIPENFAVTSEMVESLLDEGKTLEEAISNGDIYICNLKVMDGIVFKDNRIVCPAMALLYTNKTDKLMPIAIQLFQKPGPDNPVFLPSDPPYTWMLAKMYYNNAECSLHQTCTHLGFTHLLCESLCVSAHQSLSPSHPVFRLMAPHFLYLIAINSLAVEKLLASDGWIDITMSMGVSGLYEILKLKWKDWRLDVNGWLPFELKSRKVDDLTKLPEYYYREDSLKLHSAIVDYVTEVLNNIYDTPEKLRDDYEVQNFAKTLTDKENGAGIEGVFGNGKFEQLEDLIKTVTAVIYTASVMHAAANFCQYDEYAFPPNYPALLDGEPPRDKTPVSEIDIVKQIPNKDTTLSIMVVTKLLSERGTNSLGNFEIPYMYEPKALACVERFVKKLKTISAEIEERNERLETPYPYLDPCDIPNAISI